jgi:hypothetical protein
MLALASAPALVLAQSRFYYPQDIPAPQMRMADAMFGASVGMSPVQFDFELQHSNKMNIELQNISYINSIPNIDSLIQKVWTDLQDFIDSTENPLASRRIDYLADKGNTKIRILVYPPRESVYDIHDAVVTQLKMDQDTIRIRFGVQTNMTKKGMITGSYIEYNYISFILNNTGDMEQIVKDGIPGKCIALVRKDLPATIMPEREGKKPLAYYARYLLEPGIRLQPSEGKSMVRSPAKSLHIPPYIQAGVQYLRGAWAPSAGLGLEFVYKKYAYISTRYRLLWEPYFFFSRDAADKLVTQRNDFISFKFNIFYGIDRRNMGGFFFAQNYSIGYLVHRQGNWMEPSTFKFSIPGLQSKNMLVEPEFVFNNFFKNFSPSVKVVVYIE